MRSRIAPILACAAALGAPRAARADECLVNGTPLPPATLAFALEAGAGASLPGQLAGVPFQVVSIENAQILWLGCGNDCITTSYPGEARCGNLVADPVDVTVALAYVGIPDPEAVVDVIATQTASGKWNVAADAFVSPYFEPESGSASFAFALGTREVIDVASASPAEELPLAIQLRAAGHTGVQQACWGNLFQWSPQRELRFRVTEESDAPPFTRELVPTTYFSNVYVEDETWAVSVRPNARLVVDVWFHGSVNATGANDVFGNQCRGGYALLYFRDPPEPAGIQLRFTPDAALTLTPRSGITYPAVPEPSGGVAVAALALLGVAALRRE